MNEPNKLPRGATWHARWLLPLAAALLLLLFPWSDSKSPLLDGAQLEKSVAQWQVWQARIQAAREAKARQKQTAPSADGAVEVRLIAPAGASQPASR